MASHIQIGDVSPRIQYSGNGTETQFYYPFPIFKDSDLAVYCDDVLKTTGYTVLGAGDSAGGYIVFAVAPLVSETVTLTRRLTIERTSDFQESAAFRSKVLNDELDYQTAALQQLDDAHRRALHIRPHDTTSEEMYLPALAERAGKVLGFDVDGMPMVSTKTLSSLESEADNAAASSSAADASATSASASASSAAADAVATTVDRVQTVLDAAATSADRVQTGIDAALIAGDSLSTSADAVATAADRVQTGLDAVASAADRVSTNADAIATAADAVATATDVVTSAASETAAVSSATASTEWATTPENILVPSGNLVDQYSAYHWSKKAEAFATGALTYQGPWDASSGTYPIDPVLGSFYKISVTGTISGTVFSINDHLVYNGSSWDKIDNTEQVTSVAGRVGAIALDIADISGISSFSETLLDDANATVARATLGVSIGNDVPAWSAALDAVTGTNTGDEVGATATVPGIVERATDAEAEAGTDGSRYVSPYHLKNYHRGTDILSVNKKDLTASTEKLFSGIPEGTKRITVGLVGASTGGNSGIILQLGSAGGVEETDYLGASANLGSTGKTAWTNGCIVYGNVASTFTYHGAWTLTLIDAVTNTWVVTSVFGLSNQATAFSGAGSKALAGDLDRLIITTALGTDLFDAGFVNITYE